MRDVYDVATVDIGSLGGDMGVPVKETSVLWKVNVSYVHSCMLRSATLVFEAMDIAAATARAQELIVEKKLAQGKVTRLGRY